MQLSKVTYALVTAGVVGGVATFYHQIDGVTPAQAATQPSAMAQAVVPTAAANLPDFTALVDRVGPAVVNISVVRAERKAMAMNSTTTKTRRTTRIREFFKRFGGGMPNGPQMRRRSLRKAWARASS